MLLRLAYLGITNTFALLRLLPGSDRDKDVEILGVATSARGLTAPA
jgi:putative transposase